MQRLLASRFLDQPNCCQNSVQQIESAHGGGFVVSLPGSQHPFTLLRWAPRPLDASCNDVLTRICIVTDLGDPDLAVCKTCGTIQLSNPVRPFCSRKFGCRRHVETLACHPCTMLQLDNERLLNVIKLLLRSHLPLLYFLNCILTYSC